MSRRKFEYDVYDQQDGTEEPDKSKDNSIEDDEDIDDEEAFNSQDEERFGVYFPRQQQEEDDEEDDEEEMDEFNYERDQEEGNDSRFIAQEEETLYNKHTPNDTFTSKLANLLPEDYEEEIDDISLESGSDAEGLDAVLEGLDKSNKRKRRHEVTEAFNESEFGLIGGMQDRKKIGLDDLVGAVADQSNFGKLKKQLAFLEKDAKHAKLDAPLAPRLQDKMDRKAANEQAKKSVSRWIPLVKKNREAEQLVFPMNKPPRNLVTTGTLVSKFKPMNDLEAQVNQALVDTGLTEERQKEQEELELNKISAEDVRMRRIELSKMRSLLFFQEKKQKKIAKIKSKSYRKIHRKAMNENDALAEELAKLDPEKAKEMRDKAELNRAKERMTLKHKNTSKWARKMLDRNDSEMHDRLTRKIKGLDSDESEDEFDESDNDESTLAKSFEQLDKLQKQKESEPTKGVLSMKFMQRAEKMEQAELDASIEKAKRELEAYERGEEYISDENDDAQRPGNTGRRVHALQGGATAGSSKSTGGNWNVEDNEFAVKASGTIVAVAADSLNPIFPAPVFEEMSAKAPAVNEGSGRKTRQETTYRIGDGIEVQTSNDAAAVSMHDRTAPVKAADVTVDERADAKDEQPYMHTASESASGSGSSSESESEEEQGANPWLDSSESTAKKSVAAYRKHQKVGRQEKALNKLVNIRKNQIIAADDDSSESEQEATLPAYEEPENTAQVPEEEADAVTAEPVVPVSDSEDDSDYEKLDGHRMVHSSDVGKLSNLEILQLTFANDNVQAVPSLTQDFEEEKAQVMESEAPKGEDVTLPGWGTWSGPGVCEPVKRLVLAPKPGSGIDVSERKDAKLSHVIINEKTNKKALKYVIPQLPFGFQTAEQYERTLANPLGKEWNSIRAHADLIAPKVKVHGGQVINPLKFSAIPQQKRKQRA